MVSGSAAAFVCRTSLSNPGWRVRGATGEQKGELMIDSDETSDEQWQAVVAGVQ